jgi:hypothetical protein
MLVLAVAWSRRARAELPRDCEALGKAITEHSCFHSTLGPFEFREATPGDKATANTPDVSPVHTEYRVLLTRGQSSVIYRPERSGSFSIFTGRDLSVTIRREGEAARPLLFQTTDTDCAPLPLARVYELEALLTYTLTFVSDAPSDVALVIEYVDDFLVQNGIDRDGDGYGDPLEVVTSVCVPPTGYAQNTSDCDDADATVHPGAVERCGDSVDQNCNGLTDDTGLGCRTGLGVCAAQGTSACGDDGQALCVADGASPSDELCNGEDDDCDGKIDEDGALCPDSNRPRCVRSGFAAACGCQFDSDCGGSDANLRTCDVMSGQCIKGGPGTGGAYATGGEGGEASDGEAEQASGGAETVTGGGGADSRDPGGPGCSCNTSKQTAAPHELTILLLCTWFAFRFAGIRGQRQRRISKADG